MHSARDQLPGSNRSTPSPPRIQDLYGVHQRQWEDQHHCADQASTAGDRYFSPEEDDNDEPREDRYRHQPRRLEPDLGGDNFEFSQAMEEEQRRAWAEFERTKEEKGNALDADEHSPSKAHEKMKAMTREEHMKELRCPSSIPKPPPPPYDLRISHRPELWEHKLEREQEEEVQPENNVPVPVEVLPASKDGMDKRSDHSLSKNSWEAPYPFYPESNHSRQIGAAKHHSSSESVCSKKRYKSSSDDGSSHSKMPFKTEAGYGGLHPKPLQSASSGKVGAFCEKPQIMIEIQPGFSLPLRGSKETMNAVQVGMVIDTSCMLCSTAMVVADDCTFVVCPVCRTVGRAGEATFGEGKEFVGLGLLREVYDASR